MEAVNNNNLYSGSVSNTQNINYKNIENNCIKLNINNNEIQNHDINETKADINETIDNLKENNNFKKSVNIVPNNSFHIDKEVIETNLYPFSEDPRNKISSKDKHSQATGIISNQENNSQNIPQYEQKTSEEITSKITVENKPEQNVETKEDEVSLTEENKEKLAKICMIILLIIFIPLVILFIIASFVGGCNCDKFLKMYDCCEDCGDFICGLGKCKCKRCEKLICRCLAKICCCLEKKIIRIQK